jgi:hypothetical protein
MSVANLVDKVPFDGLIFLFGHVCLLFVHGLLFPPSRIVTHSETRRQLRRISLPRTPVNMPITQLAGCS